MSRGAYCAVKRALGGVLLSAAMLLVSMLAARGLGTLSRSDRYILVHEITLAVPSSIAD